jgi:O-antigen/teichoic acid export membrane protein
VVAIPASLTLAVFAEPVLWAWTGRQDIAQNAAPALTLYSLGNGILALSAFPAHLQFATGRMRMHVIGNALFVMLLIPSLIVATKAHGTTGAGTAWLASNLIYFLVWVPLVHREFIKGTHLKWLVEDVLFIAIAAICCLVVFSSSSILTHHDTRLRTGLTILMFGGLTVCAAATASSFVRASVYDFLRRSGKVLTKKEISR